jgi:hypothetical protein
MDNIHTNGDNMIKYLKASNKTGAFSIYRQFFNLIV